MSYRPLVYVFGLTLGDYLLWKWSLGNHHDTLALVSGLTLPPLGTACLWLLALALMRLIARHGRLPARRPALRTRKARKARTARTAAGRAARRRRGAATAQQHGEPAHAQQSSSGKLAA